MVCAMHRLFQSEEDDRIMEGDFDPEVEESRREEEAHFAQEPKAGLLARLLKLLPVKT